MNHDQPQDPTRAADTVPAMVGRVSDYEVIQLLRRVGSGELTPFIAAESGTWEEVFAGNVTYRVGDWTVVIFNDCYSFKYIDKVIAPDGRVGKFEDWCGTEADDYQSHQPDDQLHSVDPFLFRRVELAFVNATRPPNPPKQRSDGPGKEHS